MALNSAKLSSKEEGASSGCATVMGQRGFAVESSAIGARTMGSSGTCSAAFAFIFFVLVKLVAAEGAAAATEGVSVAAAAAAGAIRRRGLCTSSDIEGRLCEDGFRETR